MVPGVSSVLWNEHYVHYVHEVIVYFYNILTTVTPLIISCQDIHYFYLESSMVGKIADYLYYGIYILREKKGIFYSK